MTTIVHISDPHFGTVDPRVREALFRELGSEGAADVVVLTGDITQRARSRQFAEAREFIRALRPARCLALPGNHDIPLFDVITRLFNPYRLYRRYISRELEPSYFDDTVALICVDATRRTRHKHGVLAARQVARAAERIARTRQAFKIVATHQPLAVTLGAESRNLARGAGRALDRWIDAGADLFLGGHIHLPYCTIARAKRSERTAVVLQAGTAVSRRVRHGVPNSFNRLTFEASGGSRRMLLERCDYDEASQSFAMKHSYVAVATESGWRLES